MCLALKKGDTKVDKNENKRSLDCQNRSLQTSFKNIILWGKGGDIAASQLLLCSAEKKLFESSAYNKIIVIQFILCIFALFSHKVKIVQNQ